MSKGTRYPHVINTLRKQLVPDSRVLEIGCGGAIYKDMFTHYVGSDIGKTSYADPGDVDVFCDGRHLPFQASSFDLVFMVNCLLLIKETGIALNEFYRVLRPGGRILVFDYNTKGSKWVKAQQEANGYTGHSSIWSPFQLQSLVAKANFDAHVVYDYHDWEPRPGLKGWLKDSRPFQYLAFLNDQRRIGYSVVMGRKPYDVGDEKTNDQYNPATQ